MAKPTHLFRFFRFFFLFFLLSLSASESSPSSNPRRRITLNRFIWSSCHSTLHLRLCYASLSSHSSVIHNDPVTLAVVASNVTLFHLVRLSAHVASIRRSAASASTSVPPINPRTASALEDCVDAIDEAEELTRQSVAELRLLAKASGMDISWHVENAQTWLSAALTNEDTCTDGFSSSAVAVGTGNVVTDVVSRVGLAKQYTSNALALVNSLVHSR